VISPAACRVHLHNCGSTKLQAQGPGGSGAIFRYPAALSFDICVR
jgi:hypothetical protein